MVCMLDMIASSADSVEPIEMSFGLVAWVDQWICVLDRGADSPRDGAILGD